MRTITDYNREFGVPLDMACTVNPDDTIKVFYWCEFNKYIPTNLENNIIIDIVNCNDMVIMGLKASDFRVKDCKYYVGNYTAVKWRVSVNQDWSVIPMRTVPAGYTFDNKGNDRQSYENLVAANWTESQLIAQGYLVLTPPTILEPMGLGVDMPVPVVPHVTRYDYDKGILDCVKEISRLIGLSFGGDIGYETLPTAVEKALKPFVPENRPPVGSKVNTQLGGDVIEETEVLSYFKSDLKWLNTWCVTLELKSGGFKTCPVSEWQYWPIDNRTDREKYIDSMVVAIGADEDIVESIVRETIGKMYDVMNKGIL